MANTVRRWLVGHLEYLKLEELKKFKLFLLDYIPRGLLEGTDRTEVADVLVSYLGEQETWELALIIWAKMGLRELWERAWKDDLGLIPAPFLLASSDERNKYQERMRYKFRFMKEKNSRPGEYKLFHHRFTQLLLLQEYRYKEQKQHELLIHGWDHAEVMEEQGQLIDVSVLFDPVQETRVQPHTVMLQGPAGIGKTTLALKVMLDWAEGKLYQNKFNYVFFLSCRELNPLGEREISFADFIAHDWPGPQAPMTEIMSQPERLLFIIDGLDELKFPCNEHRYDLCKDWKQQRPVSILLSSLLRKIMLPEASLLLTSRLTALGKFSPLLENPRHVEILGFSVEHRKEYFCKFFRNDDLGKKAFNLVKGNATLFTMCYVPLMNWIVCTCLKQQEERGQDPIQTLKTTTALYMCYINLITPNDRNFVPQYLRGLCRLAAEGIWERKLLFEEEDLRRHGLEAADVSAFLDMNIFQKDVECENCYSFIHLSFQEFFAALFYMMRSDKERVERPDSSIPDVKKLLEEYNGNDASFVTLVVRFLFGFLNAETLRELERKFKFKMSPEIKSQLLRWVEGETKRNKIFSFSNSNLPEWYSHLYETQDAEFVTQALCDIQDIEVDFHYLYEALSAAFCIKHSPGIWRLDIAYVYDLPAYIWQDLFSVVNKNQNLKELKLSGFQLADTCLENLCVALRNPNCKLEKLTVDYFKTTYSCCQYLFSAHSLKSLHLESIFIEDDGMKLPWETLGEKKCQLQTLRIRHCKGFGVDFQDVFSFAIVNNESLKILDLYNNNLAEDEMKLLCDALAKENCKLQTLRLVCYNLMPTCFRNFFSALSSNKSLKNLYLMANCSADEGIQLLCKALGNTNCKLETLRLVGYNLTPSNFQNVFSALSNNENLKDLDLSGNSFEEEEINLLCKVLGNINCKLETLSLAYCKLTPACFQNFFSILSSNNKLKNLDLSQNSAEDLKIEFLCKTLGNSNCKLQTLRLAWCKFTPTCSRIFFSALGSNKSLKILDLSGNSFEEQGIEFLCKALGNPNFKLEKLRLLFCVLPLACLQDLLHVTYSSESLKTLDLRKCSFVNEDTKLLYEDLKKLDCKPEEQKLWNTG